MKIKVNFPVFLMFLMALMLSGAFLSCNEEKKSFRLEDEDYIIAIGDSILTLNDIIWRLPQGLSEEDSTEMASNLIESWIKHMLLTELAEINIKDKEKIERLTEEYRNHLIVSEYLRLKTETSSDKQLNKADLRKYYEENIDGFKLSRPLVKGIYLKVSDNEERLADIKGWMKKPTIQSIDRLEKNGLKNAMVYDYFINKWIDWKQITDQIPYRFGDPDVFLSKNKFFEIENSGSVYMLSVVEYIPSGEEMPYEFAEPQIREILELREAESREEKLIKSLYEDALKEGRLKEGQYKRK